MTLDLTNLIGGLWLLVGAAAFLARDRLPILAKVWLPVWFGLNSLFYLFVFFYADQGGDARIYHRALLAWLSGGDPWAQEYGGVYFAAPPPTLLYLLPFAAIPEEAYRLLAVGLNVGAAVFVLNRLKLPAWWLLFPPIVEAVSTGNPNLVMIAGLVAAHPVGDAIAGFAKVYGIIPAVILGRWRGVILFAAVLVVTAPVLPWGLFVERWPWIQSLLVTQTSGGKSALLFWPLVPAVIVALLYLGREKAAWLAVPALWPGSQFQASVIALPALGVAPQVLAAFMARPVELMAPIGICVYAGWLFVSRRRNDETRSEHRALRSSIKLGSPSSNRDTTARR